jgi:hypothetical protein
MCRSVFAPDTDAGALPAVGCHSRAPASARCRYGRGSGGAPGSARAAARSLRGCTRGQRSPAGCRRSGSGGLPLRGRSPQSERLLNGLPAVQNTAGGHPDISVRERLLNGLPAVQNTAGGHPDISVREHTFTDISVREHTFTDISVREHTFTHLPSPLAASKCWCWTARRSRGWEGMGLGAPASSFLVC